MRFFSFSNNSSFHPGRRRFYWQPVLFCLLFFLLSSGAIGYFLHDLAERANQEAIKTSKLLVSTAVGVLEEDLAGRMVDYAWWNDMYDQVMGDMDPDWADDNIGTYLQDAFSYAGTYVLSGDGEVLYSSLASETLPASPVDLLGDAADLFLTRLQQTPIEESVPLVTTAVHKTSVFLVAAATVLPEEPTEDQLALRKRPVLFFLRELNQPVLTRIEASYDVSNPRIVVGPSEQGIALRDATSAIQATIVWDQDRPGDLILVDLLPKLAAVFLLLLFAALAIYVFWIKAAMSASEAKSQLLAKMSHELRTPLNPILGFSQMMIHQTVGPIAPVYRGYAEDIHRSASHLRNVIEGLLDFSKMEAGKVDLRDDVLDLGELIGSVVQIVAPAGQTETFGTTIPVPPIHLDVADDVPRICGDEIRLRQVLINVLSNAVKFSEGNPIAIRAFKEGGAVQIAIEDNGIGISPADQRKLFEPFVQATQKDGPAPTPGTGLGLVISRELMRLHGGSLTLQSTLGQGTTVTLAFPANRTLNG